jgi:hypothetical protein
MQVSMLGLGRIIVARDLMLNGERLGGILVVAETVELAARMRRQLPVAGLTLVLSLALSLTLALRLQRRISVPIRDLAETTRNIGTRGDYRLRVGEPGRSPCCARRCSRPWQPCCHCAGDIATARQSPRWTRAGTATSRGPRTCP